MEDQEAGSAAWRDGSENIGASILYLHSHLYVVAFPL